jgi:polar amino acid transport system permease protein
LDPAGNERAGARLAGTAPPGSRGAERAAARRRRDRRGFAIAAISTFLVVGGLIALILTSPGWDEVRDTFFSSSVFKDSFPDVLSGFWLDVKMFLAIEAAVLVIGLLIAILRVSRSPALFPIRAIGAVYTDVLRGVPTILLIFLVGFGIPATGLVGQGSLFFDPIFLGGLALTLSYSAYVAEVYRAGINSVAKGQREAALAVGLTEAQAMRHVIIPQAVRRVGPPLLNDFIALQKDVALVYVLGVVEAYRIAQIHTLENFNYTPLIGVALLYLAVTLPLARLLDYWERGQAGKVRG